MQLPTKCSTSPSNYSCPISNCVGKFTIRNGILDHLWAISTAADTTSSASLTFFQTVKIATQLMFIWTYWRRPEKWRNWAEWTALATTVSWITWYRFWDVLGMGHPQGTSTMTIQLYPSDQKENFRFCSKCFSPLQREGITKVSYHCNVWLWNR